MEGSCARREWGFLSFKISTTFFLFFLACFTCFRRLLSSLVNGFFRRFLVLVFAVAQNRFHCSPLPSRAEVGPAVGRHSSLIFELNDMIETIARTICGTAVFRSNRGKQNNDCLCERFQVRKTATKFFLCWARALQEKFEIQNKPQTEGARRQKTVTPFTLAPSDVHNETRQ